VLTRTRILAHFRHKFAPLWVPKWRRVISCVYSLLKECGSYWELGFPFGPFISVMLCRPEASHFEMSIIYAAVVISWFVGHPLCLEVVESIYTPTGIIFLYNHEQSERKKQADLNDPTTFNTSGYCLGRRDQAPKTMIRGYGRIVSPLDPPVPANTPLPRDPHDALYQLKCWPTVTIR